MLFVLSVALLAGRAFSFCGTSEIESGNRRNYYIVLREKLPCDRGNSLHSILRLSVQRIMD